jgi:hypothetical protein
MNERRILMPIVKIDGQTPPTTEPPETGMQPKTSEVLPPNKMKQEGNPTLQVPTIPRNIPTVEIPTVTLPDVIITNRTTGQTLETPAVIADLAQKEKQVRAENKAAGSALRGFLRRMVGRKPKE